MTKKQNRRIKNKGSARGRGSLGKKRASPFVKSAGAADGRITATGEEFNAKLLQQARIQLIQMESEALKKDKLLVQRAKLCAQLEERILEMKEALLHHKAVGVDKINAELKFALGLRDQPLHKDPEGNVYYLESEAPPRAGSLTQSPREPAEAPEDSEGVEPTLGDSEGAEGTPTRPGEPEPIAASS